MKSPIKNILMMLLLIAAGVVLIVLSGRMKDKLNDPDMLRLTAVISDIRIEYDGDDTNHTVYVDYELDGKSRTAQLDSYSSGMRIGNELEILVDPGDPSSAMTNSKTGYRVMLGFGIVSIVCGVMTILPKRRGV